MKSFQDLAVWQKGHNLVLEVYRLSTKFPKKETFALTDQICRAAVSVTSNIAEGYGRIGIRDKCNFYAIAMGSLREVQNQMLIARDLGYITKLESEILITQADEVLSLIYLLIKNVKSRRTSP